MEKTLVQHFIDVVPTLVGMCIDYVEEEDKEYKDQIAKAIESAWEKLPDYDFHSMYDEVVEKVEMLERDGRAKRYVDSLIIPFRKYSDAFYGKEIIRLSKESIEELKDLEGSDNMIATYERQIKDAELRTEKFFKIVHTMEYERDNIESIFFEVVNGCIHWYGNMLDAALVCNHIDLYAIQEECDICVKNIWSHDNAKIRATEIDGYIGSYKLAESYLLQLSSFQSTNIDEVTIARINEEVVIANDTTAEDDAPSHWTLQNREKLQRFELRNINYRNFYNLLVDDDYGIMTSEITYDYFTDIVQRAQFGKIYQHCDTKKGKFRMAVTFLAKHTTNSEKKKEYQEAAALSMGLVRADGTADTEKVGKFNVPTTDMFRKKLEGKT